ncbi:MAG TPA: hypothetical protein VE645_19075 [Pseudonocardiaceae bacterium]|jgi:hypothetical protein|nr:hypothetical protein [Pseudonocardiaceae bacterium]
MPRTATKKRYVTMSHLPTIYSVYTVVKDDATILETLDFSEACRCRRECAGELVAVPRDMSPYQS